MAIVIWHLLRCTEKKPKSRVFQHRFATILWPKLFSPPMPPTTLKKFIKKTFPESGTFPMDSLIIDTILIKLHRAKY